MRKPGPVRTDDSDANDETRIVRRRTPRHVANATGDPADDDDQADDDQADDDSTVIVRRGTAPDTDVTTNSDETNVEDTRLVPRRARAGRPPAAPVTAPASPATPEPDDEATVRSARGNATSDTQLGSRRATLPVLPPPVDALQRRYEPPQVQSGRSERYPARPAPEIVIRPQSTAGSEPTVPDPARIALAEAAAKIRQRAAAASRRRRRITLRLIIASTLLVLIAVAAFTVWALASR